MEYYAPEEFAELKQIGQRMDFRHVEAGPLVWNSYYAERHVARKSEACDGIFPRETDR